MKGSNKVLESSIRVLIKYLTSEAEAIARLDFPAIAQFKMKKLNMAGRIEEALAAEGRAPDESLKTALEEMRQLALANAVRLRSLRDGAARASERIKKLSAERSLVGVYRANGLPLKTRSSAGTERSA
jgi:hypothetical protein